MNFSPLEKKKNAPEAPPCVRRSLIVVEKYLHRKGVRSGERRGIDVQCGTTRGGW
jgi:hypothetical protein